MKKLTLTWKKIISTILGFLGIGTLVSCYGMPLGYSSVFISGSVNGDIDGDPDTPDQPIPDIEIRVNDEYRSTTNIEGKFFFCLDYEGVYKVSFVDVDNKENGSFKTKTIPPLDTTGKSDIDLGPINLEKK